MGHAVLGGRRRRAARATSAVDRLLLGSDWPHAEGTRQPLDFVTETLAGLAADAPGRRISRHNAAELIPVAAPAPGDRSR